jgi:hypothetical protein
MSSKPAEFMGFIRVKPSRNIRFWDDLDLRTYGESL